MSERLFRSDTDDLDGMRRNLVLKLLSRLDRRLSRHDCIRILQGVYSFRFARQHGDFSLWIEMCDAAQMNVGIHRRNGKYYALMGDLQSQESFGLLAERHDIRHSDAACDIRRTGTRPNHTPATWRKVVTPFHGVSESEIGDPIEC